MQRPSPPRRGVGIDPLASRTGFTADPRSSSLPFPGFSGVRIRASPRRGTAPPRDPGVAAALGARRRGQRARSSPGRGGPTAPAWGPAAPPSLSGSACPEGSGATGLGKRWWSGGAWRRGPRGAAEAGRQPGGSACVRGCPSPAYLFVCRSVGVGRSSAPRGRGARQGPRGERALLTCSRRCRRRRRLGSETGAQPPGSSSLASSPLREPRLSSGRPLVGAGEEARGAAAVSSLAASSKSHPRALPSLAGCRGGSGPARAGGRAREAAPRRVGSRPAGGGVSSLGTGRARRGSGGRTAPLRRQPREPGALAARPACCHLALREPRGGSDSRGREPRAREQLGALGAWRGGWGDAMERIFWRKAGVIGSRVLNRGA